MSFIERVREVCAERVPLPGGGETAARHQRLFEVAREDVSLAKIVEAHWDAVAILAEAGREAEAGKIYGVWASEIPGHALTYEGGRVSGTKAFCSGAGLVDRALMTVEGGRLVDVELSTGAIAVDGSGWKTSAFALTQTSAVTFEKVKAEQVGEAGFYLERAGFWHGACGPAACWAGGAAGLMTYAKQSKKSDAHALAHLGAMDAAVWAMTLLLESAGREIDSAVEDRGAAEVRALRLRHVVVEMVGDVLRRFARAYGPHPLAMDEGMSRRFVETELYVLQSHAERDLESLGRAVRGV